MPTAHSHSGTYSRKLGNKIVTQQFSNLMNSYHPHYPPPRWWGWWKPDILFREKQISVLAIVINKYVNVLPDMFGFILYQFKDENTQKQFTQTILFHNDKKVIALLSTYQ